MEEQSSGAVAEKPRWRRIVDFPLVTMLIAIAAFVLANGAALLLTKALPPMDPLARLAIQAVLHIGLVFAAYKLLIRHLGERRHDDLPAEGSVKGLGIGVVIGAALITLMVGLAALLDVYNIVGEGHTATLLTSLIAIAILPGFLEEVMFRGILFRWIEEFGGSWAALIITSALFGLGHIFNPNASAFSSFTIAVEAGLTLGAIYMLTRSLWIPIGLHAGWNFAQGPIWDVPVSGLDQDGVVQATMTGPELLSGGQFGLEASLIGLVVAAAAGTWLLLRAIRAGELMSPWWVRRRDLAAIEAGPA